MTIPKNFLLAMGEISIILGDLVSKGGYVSKALLTLAPSFLFADIKKPNQALSDSVLDLSICSMATRKKNSSSVHCFFVSRFFLRATARLVPKSLRNFRPLVKSSNQKRV